MRSKLHKRRQREWGCPGACAARQQRRQPRFADWTYALESGFLEMLLQSEHRTLDPEEAGGGGVAANRAQHGQLPACVMHDGRCFASPNISSIVALSPVLLSVS